MIVIPQKLLNLFKTKSERILAINWGKTFLTIIYSQHEQDKIKLLAYDVYKSPRISGVQADQDAVLFIKKFLETNHIHHRKVALTISNPDEWIVKYVVLPPLPPKEILNAIKWNLQDDLKINLDKVIFKWNVLKEFNDDDGNKKLGLLVIGIKQEILNHYTDLLNKCDLIGIKITHRMINYSDCLENLSGTSNVTAVLSMGYQDSQLGFYVNKKLFYLRAIPTSLERIVQVITDRLSLGQDKKEQYFNTVKDILSNQGILQDKDGDVIVEGHSVKSFVPLLRPYLELLVREIKLSIDYFKSTFEGEAPKVFYITGLGGGIKNLDIHLKQELKMEVTTLPVPMQVDVSEKIEENKKFTIQHQLLNTLCSALSCSPLFNFSTYNKYFLILDILRKVPLRILISVLAFMTLVIWMLPAMEIKKIDMQLQSSEHKLDQMRDIKTIYNQVREREGIVKRFLSDQASAVDVMQMVSQYFPATAVLDYFDFDQASHDLLLKGHFELVDNSPQATLTEFVKKLESTKLFIEVNLVSINQSAIGQAFEIRCVFPYEKKS